MDNFNPGRANQIRSTDNTKEREIQLWHRRLEHPSFGYMKHLFPDLFTNINVVNLKCNICILAKSHRVPYLISSNKFNTPFPLVHSDVWRLSSITLSTNIYCFLTLVDDYTRMTWLYLLKYKNKVLDIFKLFCLMIWIQFLSTIKIVQSENSDEYDNWPLQEFFNTNGLIHETYCIQISQ